MRKKQQNITAYWIAFSDLLMNLFIIFLVLYGSSPDTRQLKQENETLKKKIAVLDQQFKMLEEIETAIQNLPNDLFSYDSTFKRYKLKRQIQFDALSDAIYKQEDIDYLNRVGIAIQDLVEKLKKINDKDIRYVVIIEGMASKDLYQNNDELSYRRALAVSKLWKQNGIYFDENICELQIAGSGIGGIGRDSYEPNNQRILIQILPKIRNF